MRMFYIATMQRLALQRETPIAARNRARSSGRSRPYRRQYKGNNIDQQNKETTHSLSLPFHQ
jgi:hypothetical protein